MFGGLHQQSSKVGSRLPHFQRAAVCVLDEVVSEEFVEFLQALVVRRAVRPRLPRLQYLARDALQRLRDLEPKQRHLLELGREERLRGPRERIKNADAVAIFVAAM